VNGSFEADATTGFQSVDPTGWVTHRTGAPPYLINNSTYGNTPFGNQFLAIGGSEDGAASWIEQTLSGFTIGNTYLLTWAQSSEYVSSDQLRVSFTSGSSTAPQVFTTPPYPGGTQFWIGWTNESMSFVANAASVTFHFQGVSSANYEVGVDNFQIAGDTSSVPEPSSAVLLGSAVLMLAGGGFARRLRVSHSRS
jgi:hypothetical protein